MTTGTVEGVFAELVAGLDELMPWSSVFPCSREAVVVGRSTRLQRPSARTTSCVWVQKLTEQIAGDGAVRCGDCGRWNFTTVQQLATVRPH